MAEDRDGLFERLSKTGRECAPVGYRFLHTSSLDAATILRLVESRPYRAAGYVCSSFRKPISKCCGPPLPEPDA
jgi:hypothetical protein